MPLMDVDYFHSEYSMIGENLPKNTIQEFEQDVREFLSTHGFTHYFIFKVSENISKDYNQFKLYDILNDNFSPEQWNIAKFQAKSVKIACRILKMSFDEYRQVGRYKNYPVLGSELANEIVENMKFDFFVKFNRHFCIFLNATEEEFLVFNLIHGHRIKHIVRSCS